MLCHYGVTCFFFKLQMFSQVHFQLKSIKRHTLHFTGIEAILIHNIVSYLSNRMCQMTEMFQKQQGDYMKSSYLQS